MPRPLRLLRLAEALALMALPVLGGAVQPTQTSASGSSRNSTSASQGSTSTSRGSSAGISPDSSTASILKPLADARSYLERHGVTVAGYVQIDTSHVLSGGVPQPLGFDLQHLLDVNVTLDTGKLLGGSGGTLFVDVQNHYGPNIIAVQVPAIADPDNMDAYNETSIDRAWFGQDLAGQRVHVQIGLMYVDDQFFTVPYGGNFVSLDFSSDASISTFVLPTYPKGAWGADVCVDSTRSLSFSAGIFRDHETELPYDPGGALLVSEEAWQSTWLGLPYKLQLGAWLDTGRFQRFLGGTTHSAHGVYAVASDKLWQPAGSTDRGLGMFFQFGTAPPEVAPVQTHYGVGLVWTGPLASRPHDEIGVALSDSHLTAQGGYSNGFESEIEAYYQIEVVHGLTIQPDLEYWEHPGGMGTPNSVLGLIRFMYTF